MTTHSKWAAATTLALILSLPSVSTAQMSNAKQPGNIVQVLVANGNFKTLVTAVQAAGLVETLSAPGPFTVFAPTDAAFAKLPAGTLESLLANKQALSAILTYHVLAGKVTSAQIVQMGGAKPATVNGQTLEIVLKDGKVFVNNAQVTIADMPASNGVIHVIDAVLIPSAAK